MKGKSDFGKLENAVMPNQNGFNSNLIKSVVERTPADRKESEIKRSAILKF